MKYRSKPAEQDSLDEGYDGYYDDVPPTDDGCIRNRRSLELVKRVVFVAVGAIVVIALAVVLMYLL